MRHNLSTYNRLPRKKPPNILIQKLTVRRIGSSPGSVPPKRRNRNDFAVWNEPGFIARIKDTTVDCETAILNPDARAAEQRRRAFEAKAAREYAEERAREARTARTPAEPKPQADPGAFQLDFD